MGEWVEVGPENAYLTELAHLLVYSSPELGSIFSNYVTLKPEGSLC